MVTDNLRLMWYRGRTKMFRCVQDNGGIEIGAE